MDLTKIDVPNESQKEELRFAAFAEAPGPYEMKAKKPLVPYAPSGKMWNRLLYVVGIRRRNVYVGNFCHTQLPGNDTEKLWKVTPKGNFKTAEGWNDLVERFRSTLRSLECQAVLLLGETPLVGLFGPDHRLGDTRGYPFYWEDKLIIPTHHPASMLPGRSPSNFWLTYFDIHKLLRIQSEGRRVDFDYNVWIPGRGEVIESL